VPIQAKKKKRRRPFGAAVEHKRSETLDSKKKGEVLISRCLTEEIEKKNQRSARGFSAGLEKTEGRKRKASLATGPA